MSEREPDLERMLELYRDARAPDAATQSRVWASVESGIGPAAGSVGTAGAPGVFATTAKLLTLAVLVSSGALWFLWPGAEATPSPQPEPEKPTPAIVVAPVSDEPAQTVVASTPPQVEEPLPTAETAVRPQDSEPGRARRKPPNSTLAAEMKLVTAAQAALDAGAHARALGLLRRHGQRFPDGALSEEREAALVQALCGLGREQSARRVAEHFAERFPGSPRSARVRQVCSEEAP